MLWVSGPYLQVPLLLDFWHSSTEEGGEDAVLLLSWEGRSPGFSLSLCWYMKRVLIITAGVEVGVGLPLWSPLTFYWSSLHYCWVIAKVLILLQTSSDTTTVGRGSKEVQTPHMLSTHTPRACINLSATLLDLFWYSSCRGVEVPLSVVLVFYRFGPLAMWTGSDGDFFSVPVGISGLLLSLVPSQGHIAQKRKPREVTTMVFLKSLGLWLVCILFSTF